MSFTDNKWDELNKTNVVYFNSTLHNIEHLGSWLLANANQWRSYHDAKTHVLTLNSLNTSSVENLVEQKISFQMIPNML